MKWGWGFAFLLGAASGLTARQDDAIERQVQRMKDQVQLTDEQVAKARDILKSANDKIRETLTDEQKPKFDEMNSGRGGRAFAFGGGGGGRMMMGGGIPPAEALKEPLGLSDDQVKKIDAIVQDIRSSIRDYWQNGGDREGFQDFMKKSRDEGIKKVKEVLTDEQKAKLDKLLADMSGGGPPSAPSLEERVTRAMNALKIEKSDEAATVKEAVTAVLKAQEKFDSAQREMRGKADEIVKNTDLSEDAVGDRLKELRTGVTNFEKELRAAQRALREILTNRQEVELIRQGILR